VNSLKIEGTKSTPQVDFDAASGSLSLRGESYPENAFKFFEPLLAWVRDYLAEPASRPLSIELCLPYINTSSSKCLMMLLDKLSEAKAGGRTVDAAWIFDPANESEKECAEEFAELVDLGIRLVPSGRPAR